MKSLPLDIYDYMEGDEKTEDQILYLRKYGWHFSKKAIEFAVSKMWKRDPANPEKKKAIELVPVERIDAMLEKHGIKLKNEVAYDHSYVYHTIMADKWGSSIEDEQHAALAVKDTIDDPDAADGTVFRMWVAKLIGEGTWIPWRKLI